MIARGLAAVTLWSVLLTHATARDIFVDNVTGDDVRDGSATDVRGMVAGPCRTIARALELAKSGDRIILADTGEAYRESITLQAGRHCGIRAQRFTILGSGAILDGSRPVPVNAWKHVRGYIYRFRPERVSYQVLYLDGKPAKRRTVKPGERLPDLAPLEWCLYEGEIHFCTEKGKRPRIYNLAYTALPVGITLYEVRHVLISDLIVQGFQLDGINAHDSVFDATLVGLTCRGNGRSGISIGGASRVDVTACLIGDNGSAQIRTEGFSRTRIANCHLIDTSAPALVREGGLVTMLTDEAAKPEE